MTTLFLKGDFMKQIEVIDTILDKIIDYDQIVIHRHVRPDPDAFGSQIGLAEIIKASYPEKHVFVVGEEEESLLFLAKMDVVDDAFFHEALAIVCDTANRGRIDDERYLQAKEIIKIDHHPEVDAYGDISWVDTSSSSTSEMIYQLFQVGKSRAFQFTDHAAKLLYAGIIGDTGRFLFPSTTKRTFEYAAELVQYNFDRTKLYNQLYEMDASIAQLKGYILSKLKINEHGVSSVRVTKDILENYNITAEQTSKLVGVLGDIKGIQAWVIFVEEEELIRARIRSKGPAINEIAAQFNGGGHPLASGATVFSWEEAEQLVQALTAVCE